MLAPPAERGTAAPVEASPQELLLQLDAMRVQTAQAQQVATTAVAAKHTAVARAEAAETREAAVVQVSLTLESVTQL